MSLALGFTALESTMAPNCSTCAALQSQLDTLRAEHEKLRASVARGPFRVYQYGPVRRLLEAVEKGGAVTVALRKAMTEVQEELLDISPP